MICNTKYKNLFGLKKKIYDKKQKAHNKLIQSKACDFKIKIMWSKTINTPTQYALYN